MRTAERKAAIGAVADLRPRAPGLQRDRAFHVGPRPNTEGARATFELADRVRLRALLTGGGHAVGFRHDDDAGRVAGTSLVALHPAITAGHEPQRRAVAERDRHEVARAALAAGATPGQQLAIAGRGDGRQDVLLPL